MVAPWTRCDAAGKIFQESLKPAFGFWNGCSDINADETLAQFTAVQGAQVCSSSINERGCEYYEFIMDTLRAVKLGRDGPGEHVSLGISMAMHSKNLKFADLDEFMEDEQSNIEASLRALLVSGEAFS